MVPGRGVADGAFAFGVADRAGAFAFGVADRAFALGVADGAFASGVADESFAAMRVAREGNSMASSSATQRNAIIVVRHPAVQSQ